MKEVDLNIAKKAEGIKDGGGGSEDPTTLASLEEKIDKVLKYQKTTRALAIFRGIVSFLFFFIFIVLPIIGGFYLFRFIQDTVDFESISGQYKEFYQSLDDLKEGTSKINNIFDKDEVN